MLAQCCSGGKANFWVLLACVVSAWLLFSWVPSVWRAKGDVMSKILKIVIVIGLIASVAVVLAVKQGRTVPSGSSAGGTQALASPSGLPRLIDLGSGLCIPCKMMASVLEDLKKEYAGRLEVVFIDLRDDPGAATRYRVEVMPTQIFYDPNGQELFRHEGFFAKDGILAQWKDLGFNLTSASAASPESGRLAPDKVDDRPGQTR